MPILTGPEIKRLAEGGTGANGERIVITPFDPARCGPASYDLHLGDTLRRYKHDVERGGYIDPLDPPETFDVPHYQTLGGWLLSPGRVYLGVTREYTETHGLAAQVGGRSSWGRYGLSVHVTAGFIDPGFCGSITLELVATQPILVRPGDKIAQIVYQTITGEYQPYQGRYQGATEEPTASRFHLPDPTGGEE